ncbi:MAG: HipA domain-containing protein [Candidatus Latescibacteria bacterium]|nr:HipA domain-containing protein [Candidatus Latescibacterota bacterium]
MGKSPCYFEVKEVRQEWILDPEEMGSKRKFWFRRPGEGESEWLFKYPREDTGEHWAEKIAAEIAELLDIRHATVEFAIFEGVRGSVTESFVDDEQELVHGNQMLEWFVRDYVAGRKYGQSSHTLKNIWQVMDEVFVESEAKMQGKLCIAEYLVLDALIGNTDRHHENWGILFDLGVVDLEWLLAPSFDHASSLGRELRDERRSRLLDENRVGDYVEKGHGAIFWSEEDQRGPGPLELARRSTRSFPDFFLPAIENLKSLSQESLIELVDRVPCSWMSPLARKFAIAQMRYSIEQLGGLVQ